MTNSDSRDHAAVVAAGPLDTKQILAMLPHRYPFLFVDKVLELEPGARAVAVKNVTINEPFFQGHFPGHPIMPGVLLIEMLAQIGGIMLLALAEHKGKLAYLAGVDKTRFRKPVQPGDTLVAQVVMTRVRGNVGWAKGEARVDDKLVCEAELIFSLADRTGTGL